MVEAREVVSFRGKTLRGKNRIRNTNNEWVASYRVISNGIPRTCFRSAADPNIWFWMDDIDDKDMEILDG